MERENIKSRHGLFLLLGVVALALFLNPLMEVAALTRKSELYSHIPLIPIVSLYFLFMIRKRVFADAVWSPVPGGVLIGAGLLCFGVGAALGSAMSRNDYLSLMMFGLVCWVVGAFTCAYGVQAFKRALFPLLFLVFLVPVPEVIIDPYITLLQRLSADSSHLVFILTGVPFFREGQVFALPGMTVEVAKECSGIRSSLALIITCVVAGKLFLDNKWLRGVLVLAVIPVTIFKNSLRIVTLSILGAYVDPAFITGHWLHRSGGMPFFVVGLLLMAPVLWGLRRVEKGRLERKAKFEVRSTKLETNPNGEIMNSK
ncbi:MAG: exosortase [Deltaproteobacteria bacterium]|nr:exosortase [Deltaproteobacteria bacterium]